MKKLLFVLVAVLSLSPVAKAEKAVVNIAGVQVDLEYIDANKDQKWYNITGTIKVPNQEKSCNIKGFLAYYGNSQSDKITLSCGTYIVRIDTDSVVIKEPVQGYSFRLVTQVDLYGNLQTTTLGTKAIELRFTEAQTIEPRAKSDRPIDKN